MSEHSVFNHGGHTVYESNSSNVTNVGIAEHYNYSNSGRHDGRVYSINISHTHTVSGSTGEMSGDDYATIHLLLDDGMRTWNDVRTSWSVPNRTAYDANSGYNDTGQNAYCTIDLSHTHTLSPVALVK